MLDKFSKKICDAHFHFADSEKLAENCVFNMACSCAHSVEEWNVQKNCGQNIVKSFGLHPQSCVRSENEIKKNYELLERLLSEKELFVIGECGFDFFTEDFKERRDVQEKMWNWQLELALKYNVPVVIHCRKANEKLFEYSRELKKLPAVLFHSFMGSTVEAKSLIKKGINVFFSFGKQMKNNNKKVIECVMDLPLENLLFETDAPYQFLKGEKYTKPCEIADVYEAAIQIRNVKGENYDDFFNQIFMNFEKCFMIYNKQDL